MFWGTIAVVLALCDAPRAESATPERYRVSAVTLGPGEYLFTRFGHTAIRLTDRETGIDKVYNFGDFDFSTPNLTQRFLTGTLRYYVSVSAFDSLKRTVEKSAQSLTEQVLDLSSAETRRVREMLDLAVAPEHRNYPYDHYRANCCTKVRDLLDEATSGLIRNGRQRPNRTFRYWTRRSLADAPLLELFFDWVLSRRIDAPVTDYEALYRPRALAEALTETRRADGRPLVSAVRMLLPDRTQAASPMRQQLLLLSAAVLLLLLAVSPAVPGLPTSPRVFGAGLLLFGAATGAAGTLLGLLRVVTDLPDLQAVENLFVFPPTHWGFFIAGAIILRQGAVSFRVNRWTTGLLALSSVSALAALLLKLGPFGQENLRFLGFDILWLLCAYGGLVAVDRARGAHSGKRPVER